MGLQIKTVTETITDSDRPGESITKTRREFFVGDSAEPLRPIHAMMLITPLGVGMAANSALGGGFVAGTGGTMLGFWIGSLAVALEEKARQAVRAESQRRDGLGLPKLGGLEKGRLALREFSSLVKFKAKASALGAGVVFGGAPVALAQWATKRLPRVNAVLNKANPALRSLGANTIEAELDFNLSRGAKHCERLVWKRLAELENGECSKPSDQLAKLWRASGLTGLSECPGEVEKGSIVKRVGDLLSTPPKELAKDHDFNPEDVKGWLRLCEVSAEALELTGVVGEARLTGASINRRPGGRL